MTLFRRAFFNSEPESFLMMGMGLIALIANVACLIIIRRHNSDEVHMRASWIFSANDVIANTGVVLAGAMVWWLESRWPDLIIGFIVAIVVIRGAFMILTDAREEKLKARKPTEQST